jgi:adenine-specific DNA-methyltransferase
MAKRPSPPKVTETTDYRHDAKRKNIPAAAMEAEGQLPRARRVKYAYSPHLDPVLRFDPTGRADKVASIVEKACRSERLDKSEQEILRSVGQNWEQPWLEWAGKQEEHARGHFAVDPVALHIHERISAQAILRNAMREDAQRSLFGAPEQTYAEALQFYRHDVDWANRLILGDSLQVMSSLAQREDLAGKVQMIYIDPPYGIKFGSNFQPEVGKRDVKDGKDEDLTREPEMVRAFRDTWHLGVSSYLSYLQQRFYAARDLLAGSGHLFVQISFDNLHLVRAALDEVMGAHNFCSLITFAKTTGQTDNKLASVSDYLLWYAKDSKAAKYRQLFQVKQLGGAGATAYRRLVLPTGEIRSIGADQSKGMESAPPGSRLSRLDTLTSQSPGSRYDVATYGRLFHPKGYWKTDLAAMPRLVRAERTMPSGSTNLYFVRYVDDFAAFPIADSWSDTVIAGFASDKRYVVETSAKVIERCLLMTTDPGDLVLDPTCGSGTTAHVAEQWGRRWITIDTSRVALSIARQRILTSRFEHYRTNGGPSPSLGTENPSSGFKYKTVPHITLGAIAQNTNLDPISAKHEPVLAAKLGAANKALAAAPATLRDKLKAKLSAKEKAEGKKSITDADRRRWILPPNDRDPKEKWTVDVAFAGWYEWEVPFDTDPDWPKPLQDAVLAYRVAWRAKMDEVNKCIADNAEQEELVDQPEVVRNVVRVSGPFTVEGVIPEELSLSDDCVFDPTPNEFEAGRGVGTDPRNLSAYLSRMVAHLRTDGLTFLNNQRKHFERLDPIFEDSSGSFLHAEGSWKDESDSLVAVTFGPQYGSVTALQVEEAIRAAKRYTDLVLAGFSFDAETYAIVEQQQHPRLRIHIAQIRPDMNDSMDGLLKITPNSQLFTVFGQPDIDVKHTKEGWVCTLQGVDIYNPTDNTLRSSGADKVSAWFLDSDYDGRCFCATQAFFPNRDAWEKIARALGSQADAEAFEAFNGTSSLPFEKGKYGRIAVKVIDPRGNEVMAIRTLK